VSTIKKYLTMWQVWAGITVVLAILVISGVTNFAGFLPFILLLACPIIMMFMMRGHKHK